MNCLSSKYDSNFPFHAPFLDDIASTSWVDALRSTLGFSSVSLSIDMDHIQSQHAYSYEKAYTGVASLFCKSLGLYIKTLIEYAVWNCMRQINPIIYLGASIVPMLCEFPQYIGWGLTGRPTQWLEVQLPRADLHIGQAFPACLCNQYVSWIAIILHYCSCCVLLTVLSIVLLIY